MKHVKQNIPEYNKKNTSANSGFNKLAVQWSIEHLCFVSSVVLADSLVLRNRQLLKPAKRWASLRTKKNHISIINNYIYESKVETRNHSKKRGVFWKALWVGTKFKIYKNEKFNFTGNNLTNFFYYECTNKSL